MGRLNLFSQQGRVVQALVIAEWGVWYWTF